MKRHRDFGMTQKSVWYAGLPERGCSLRFLKGAETFAHLIEVVNYMRHLKRFSII